jgi:hypothetical protein
VPLQRPVRDQRLEIGQAAQVNTHTFTRSSTAASHHTVLPIDNPSGPLREASTSGRDARYRLGSEQHC